MKQVPATAPDGEAPTGPPTTLESSLLDRVQAAVVATDAVGSVSQWNRFAEILYGWPRSQAIGRPLEDVLFAGRMPAELETRVLSGASWEGELPTRHRDGSLVETYVRLSPLLDEEGRAAGTVAVVVDITERKQVERRLYAQYAVTKVLAEAESLRAATPLLLEAVGDSLNWQVGAIWRVDGQEGVLRCVDVWRDADARADEFIELTQQTTFEPGRGLPGRVWKTGEPNWIVDVAQDDNFPRAPAAISVGLRSAFGFPIRLRRDVLGVIEFFTPEIREPDEALLAMMATVGSQIGQFIERKEAEEAVRDSEARKAAILSSAIDCVISMDHRGCIVDFNPAAERTFGHERDDVIGKPLAELIIPPSLRERHERGLMRYLSTGESSILGKRVELRGMRADGTEFPVELAVTRVDRHGPPLFTGYLRDITDRVRSQAEREQLLAAEQSAREASERATERLAFLADASIALTSSLDYRRTLRRVARLAVPRVADMCLVYTIQEDRSIQRLAVEVADPALHDLPERIEEYRIDPGSPEGVPKVVRTGKAELHAHADARLLAAATNDPDGLAAVLEPVGISSWMCVPLMARGRVLGAISLVSTRSGHRFGVEDLALAEDLARRAAVAIDNARLFEERAGIARSLQRSLLPPELPQIPGLELAARYRPARAGTEVGGDFYDLFEIAGGRWGVAVGDVCGKGAEAAALTGLARYTIREAAMHDPRPSSVLGSLNQALMRNNEAMQLCTVAFGQVEKSSDGMRLIVACGGHPLPLLLRADGRMETAGRSGTILGVFDDPDIPDLSVELSPGDAILFYTDGVTDERSSSEGFGEQRLRGLLRSCRGMTAEAIADIVDRAVTEAASDEPFDDVAILAMRVTP